MTVGELRYSKKEFARRGNEIYETQVRQKIEEESDRGKFVPITFGRLRQRYRDRSF